MIYGWLLFLCFVVCVVFISCGGDLEMFLFFSNDLGCVVVDGIVCLLMCVFQCDVKFCGFDGCGGQCGLCDLEFDMFICDENIG